MRARCDVERMAWERVHHSESIWLASFDLAYSSAAMSSAAAGAEKHDEYVPPSTLPPRRKKNDRTDRSDDVEELTGN